MITKRHTFNNRYTEKEGKKGKEKNGGKKRERK